MDFDTEVRVARYGGGDYPRLIERIRGRKPDGWTALYDAIGVYLNGAADQDGQKVLIIYTDGGDTRSSLTFQDMLDLLQGVGRHRLRDRLPASTRRSRPRPQQRQQLERVAADDRRAGVLSRRRQGARQDVRRRSEREIAARYSLGYMSTDDPHERRLAARRDQAEAARSQGARSCAPGTATSRLQVDTPLRHVHRRHRSRPPHRPDAYVLRACA